MNRATIKRCREILQQSPSEYMGRSYRREPDEGNSQFLRLRARFRGGVRMYHGKVFTDEKLEKRRQKLERTSHS